MNAVVAMGSPTIPSLSDARIPIFLSVPLGQFHGDTSVRVRVARADDPRRVVLVTGTFLGPSR
jgi:hypothetical protein